MGLQWRALQNVVTQSCFPTATGYILKNKPCFGEVAVASNNIKQEKMEKPKGNFSLWCYVLLRI